MQYLIDPISGCWTLPALARYPTVKVEGKNVRAHRHFAEAHGQMDIEGVDVHHTCRNSRCVNPDHLETVDHAEHGRLSGASGPRKLHHLV